MEIANCLRALQGSTELVATRPSRTIIKLTKQQMIQVHGPRGWYRWCPALFDLVAVDWEVMHQDKLRQMIEAEMEAANSQAQAG